MAEPSAPIAIAKWAWKERSGILKSLQGVYRWFQNRMADEHGILILGPGGTGKSTLAGILSGKYDFLLDATGGYEESIGMESVKVKGSPRLSIVVPPGQKHRREATWTDPLRELSNGHFRGIILVPSFGYHSLGEIRIENHKLYRGDKTKFLVDYLAEMRKDEMRVVKQVADHIRQNRHPLWLLTLVTKQDLWWEEASAVEHHYGMGDYAKLIAGIADGTDPKQFRHELWFGSLTISNFVTGRGDVLKPNVEGYDHRLQAATLRRLFEMLDALKKWELKK